MYFFAHIFSLLTVELVAFHLHSEILFICKVMNNCQTVKCTNVKSLFLRFTFSLSTFCQSEFGWFFFSLFDPTISYYRSKYQDFLWVFVSLFGNHWKIALKTISFGLFSEDSSFYNEKKSNHVDFSTSTKNQCFDVHLHSHQALTKINFVQVHRTKIKIKKTIKY